MKRNAMVILTLILAMSTLLAACGGKNNNESSLAASPSSSAPAASESASPSEEVKEVEPFTVSLRHIQIGEPQKFRKAILDEVVKRTEAEVPGLKFELDGIEDAVNRFTKLPAEMAAGNPPKIFDLFGGNADALKYAKAGRMLDLTPILDELQLKDKFLNVFGQFTLDGKIYGLPIGGNMEGVFYNTEIFEQNGLNAPKTWDDLIKAADTLKGKGITPFAHLYNDEMQLRGLLEDGVLPSMKLSDEALAKVTDPLVKQVMETMAGAGSSFVHFDSVVQKAVNAESEIQLQKLIAGKATPQEAGDAIQKVQDAENGKK